MTDLNDATLTTPRDHPALIPPLAPPAPLPRPGQRRPPRRKRQHTFYPTAMRLLLPADRRLFERFGQGPIVDLPYDRLHHAFEAQAAARPHATAAEHLGTRINYQQLERQANRLAARLGEEGVQPGDAVGVFLHRSIPMLVGILATLKVGAAYVPQHVGTSPDSRLQHIAEAASTRVILTLSSLQQLVPQPEAGYRLIAINELMAEPFDDPTDYLEPYKPQRPIRGDDRCFILFTSGTTGTPNGVQVTHRNVCNILLTEPGNLGIRPGMRVGQILSIAFDMAAWEIFSCLSHGATLVIRGPAIEETARQVDVLIATPTILGSLDADKCRSVRVAAVAGEPCPQPLAETWSEFCTFYNSCGPTETTIINTAQRYDPARPLTIGAPTPNNTVYILDQDRRPLPIGEVGEMWAGGLCVTAGYLDNDELNAERYAADPFLGEGHRMFRTRDLGRWTDSGELEHHGRTDDQVKVRGFRVELDAVSTILESHPDISTAVTLKLDDRNLVSFVRPGTVDVEQAKQSVEEALPYYAVPCAVLAMDQLPRTSRGKVDKRALLQLAKDALAEGVDDPAIQAQIDEDCLAEEEVAPC